MQSSSCSGKWSLPEMLIMDLSLTRVVQHSPFPVLIYALPTLELSLRINGAVRTYEHAHDKHYLTRSKFNSLLTKMITPQTYIQVYIYSIHIKPLPVPRVFGSRTGSPRIILCWVRFAYEGNDTILYLQKINFYFILLFYPQSESK